MTNPNKVGFVFGVVFSGMHLLWSILVLLGVAQALYSFILWAHMAHADVTVGPFDISAAATLIIVTAIIGYIVGYMGAQVWNKVHR